MSGDPLSDLVGFCEDIMQDGKRGQVIPDYSCPLIDAVAECIRDAEKDIAAAIRALRNSDDEGAQEASGILNWINLDCLEKLEQIRRANDELRDLGKKWYLIAKEMSERVASECESLTTQDTP